MRLEPIIESLKSMGFNQEEAEKILVELIIIQKGRTWEHAHLDDIHKIAHRVLDWQQNKSITLKITKESDDVYDGHLEIEVIDIQKGKQP